MALARDHRLELGLGQVVGERGHDPLVALAPVDSGVCLGLGRHDVTNLKRRPMPGPPSVIDSFAASASVSMTTQEKASMFGPIGHRPMSAAGSVRSMRTLPSSTAISSRIVPMPPAAWIRRPAASDTARRRSSTRSKPIGVRPATTPATERSTSIAWGVAGTVTDTGPRVGVPTAPILATTRSGLGGRSVRRAREETPRMATMTITPTTYDAWGLLTVDGELDL